MIGRLRAWFESREPRERAILAGGAVATVLIVGWAVFRPLLLETGALRESVTVQQRLLIDLARLEALGNGGPSTAPVGVQSLLSLVDGTARTHGFSPRMRADGPDAVNVTFERVPFDGLLRWLIQLETTHGVSVESASFSGARERGLVNGQLFLRRS